INNFTHKKLYKNGKITFVRLPVAKALKEIQTELTSIGYNLKIFDAYRPFHVSKKMWELIHDPRYVADPSKGSGHNRGLALDLTIIDLKTGREVNMGTDFDNFTDSAHHDFQDLPQDVLENRILLKHVMESHGFNALETEWWHYSWPDNRNYEVLDLGFRTLLKPYF
ncbi:MAG TPA: M15 family metallopeptidase, partial [Flavisolibacter sp.]|nr:M15 family metallopeptidase [Flavisolibacter sp.]